MKVSDRGVSDPTVGREKGSTVGLRAGSYVGTMYRALIHRASIYRAPIYRTPTYRGPTYRAPIYRAHIYIYIEVPNIDRVPTERVSIYRDRILIPTL